MTPVSAYCLIGESNMMGPPLHYFTEPIRQAYAAFRLFTGCAAASATPATAVGASRCGRASGGPADGPRPLPQRRQGRVHGTRADAMQAKTRMDRNDARRYRLPYQNLRVYECPNCRLWHVGHDKLVPRRGTNP